MEELKLLISMVADLPHAALWVIAGVLIYKVVIIGSIYGVIRLAIVKAHDWLVRPAHQRVVVEMVGTINGMAITGCVDAFIAQLHRLRGKGTNITTQYVHEQSVTWLREAIDAKEALDNETALSKGKPLTNPGATALSETK